MSNQEIHIHTHTSSDGIVHIDIPVGIADQDIEVTVSYLIRAPTQEAPNVDHLLGSFNSRDGQHQQFVEKNTEFGNAVIEKLAAQGVELQ